MQAEPILIVDNTTQSRSEMSAMLIRCGYDADAVADGSEALRRLNTIGYRLVVTDEAAHDASGGLLFHQIADHHPTVPVIVVSAKGDVHRAVDALHRGACDYLIKPIAEAQLCASVRRGIGHAATDAAHCAAVASPAAGNGNGAGRQVIAKDIQMQRVLEMARTVAPSQATVLIQGESGTGKEVLAAYIHQHSGRAKEPYVATNCAALPEQLAESELFGHEKGSFTGAVSRKIGKFEQAGSGTLVLDEISEMPMSLQAKLLRVLQERHLDRVGGQRPVAVHARTIAISNVDLRKAVSKGRFREDLFYRINVIPLTIPPLRERTEDIPELTQYFIDKCCRLNALPEKQIDSKVMQKLMTYAWPGNVRELENTIERAVLLSAGDSIDPGALMLDGFAAPTSRGTGGIEVGMSVREMEKQLICKTLEKVDDNRTHAAKMLGISIRTLRNKLNEYRQEEAC